MYRVPADSTDISQSKIIPGGYILIIRMAGLLVSVVLLSVGSVVSAQESSPPDLFCGADDTCEMHEFPFGWERGYYMEEIDDNWAIPGP